MERENRALPFVTVYSITYKQKEIVEATAIGLFDQIYPRDDYEIVILDDGSNDGTSDLLAGLANQSPVPMKVLSVEHEADYLIAKRSNQCIAAASGETEVFVQVEDALVRPDFVWQHVKWHVQGVDALVSGAMFEADTETWDLVTCYRGNLAGPAGAPVECDFRAIWAKSMSFTRDMMQRVWREPHDKPFDERMTGWGYHEVEFAWRMSQMGVRMVYDPAAGVFHRRHTPATDGCRGFDREAIVREGTERNVTYVRKKHGFDDLDEWVVPRRIEWVRPEVWAKLEPSCRDRARDVS